MADYSNYRYDPFGKDTVSELEKLPEFQFECPDKAKAIAYLIMTYDPKNDFIKLYGEDFGRRKREAALKAGFKLGKGGLFDTWVEDMLIGKSDEFNDAVVAYVRLFDLADFPAWCAYREIFFKEVKAAMSDQGSKDRKTVLENLEKSRSILSNLEKKLFTGEETADVRNALYRLAEKQKLQLRPEDMAKLIADKELKTILPDPYKIYDHE